MEMLLALEYWHWWILALALVIFEVMGAAGFLLGTIAAALVTGVIALATSLGWEVQLTIFAVLAVLLTVVYYKRFRKFNQTTDNEALNTIELRLLGKYGEVIQQVATGEVKIKVGDTLWTATTDQALNIGDQVSIVSVEAQTPHVALRS